MFDLITGNTEHAPRPQTLPIIVSIAVHAAAIGAIVFGTVLVVSDELPQIPTMMAFAAAPPSPPPPPPPPPPPAAPKPAPEVVAKPTPTVGAAAPVEAPVEIAPEPPPVHFDEEGVVGGVPGGMPGGVVGGVPGGLAADIPPPPPLPPAPREPVRVGGSVEQPTLLHRVDPVYPQLAVAANIEGSVILEALVDEEGRVLDLRVLRSAGVLDKAALAAVRQWRYSPVLLNGRPEKFILTVVVTFRLEGR
jgi:protein TonB